MSYGAADTTPSAGRSNVHSHTQLPPANTDATDQEPPLEEVQQASKWRRICESSHSFYERNLGLFMVFLAQTCGSIVRFSHQPPRIHRLSFTNKIFNLQMNTAAKLLANDPSIEFHALHIIFIRMLFTTVIGSVYMWYHKVPHLPLGPSGIRKLLILRGTAGFIGLFGLYYSLSWLAISDATVITFLIPTMTAIICFIWLREPFTWKEALCSFIAFSGVLFVARPPWLFHSTSIDDQPSTTPHQRALAVSVAILGTFGASTAYATIRVIGKRAHSLISVNYFASIATLGSTLIILVHPELHFVVPKTLGQWGLITIIGLFGFLLQFLLTEGLQREKGGRATNLTYLQLVFALGVERAVWGTTPPVESLVGAVLIVGAAAWVSLQKKVVVVVDEERSLLRDEEERAD